MIQPLINFRIFDRLQKKYLTADSKVFIGLDGKVVTLEEPDAPDRYSAAYSLPLYDIKGQQLFTDDGFLTIIDRDVEYAQPTFDKETNAWVGFIPDRLFSLAGKEFQILPNAQQIAQGYMGTEIQSAWEQKAAELPAPPAPEETRPVFTRSREFKFGIMKVLLTLESETDMPDDVWEEHFTAVLQCDDIFQIKHQPEEVVTTDLQEPLKAIKIQCLDSDAAPDGWRNIPELAAAYPPHKNVDKSLRRLDGTNIAMWEISRAGRSNVASDFFLVSEAGVPKLIAADEPGTDS